MGLKFKIMKKNLLGFLTLIMLFGSTTNMSSSTQKLINSEYPVSCFEEGNYYAQWWGARTGASAFETLEMALLYTRLCKQEREDSLQRA